MPRVRLKDGLFQYEKYGLPYWGFRLRVTRQGRSRLIQRQGFRTKRLAAQQLNALRLTRYQHQVDPAQSSRATRWQTVLARYAPQKPEPWATATRREKMRYSTERPKHRFWLDHLGDLPVTALTPAIIEQAMQSRPWKTPATYNHYLIFLKKVCNAEADHGRLAVNPAKRVPLRPKTKQPKYQFTPAQEQALLDNLDPFSQAVVQAGIYTGMRISELFEARKADLALADNRLILPDPKAREPQIVRLFGPGKAAIEQLLHWSTPKSPWLIPSPKYPHKPRDSGAWRRQYLNPVLQQLGLYATHNFHETRKTYTARLLATGTPTAITKALTRHKTLATVEDYAAWFDDQLYATLERAFSGTPRHRKYDNSYDQGSRRQGGENG